MLSQSKQKHKNAYEDLLFKNEDDMYSIDHVILQYETVVQNLKKEYANAILWENQEANKVSKSPYKIKHLSCVTQAYIDQVYGQLVFKKLSIIKMMDSKPPVGIIQIILDRFMKQLDTVRQAKYEQVEAWKLCCEVNFLKSLDHRSFFFKDAHKKRLQGK